MTLTDEQKKEAAARFNATIGEVGKFKIGSVNIYAIYRSYESKKKIKFDINHSTGSGQSPSDINQFITKLKKAIVLTRKLNK